MINTTAMSAKTTLMTTAIKLIHSADVQATATAKPVMPAINHRKHASNMAKKRTPVCRRHAKKLNLTKAIPASIITAIFYADAAAMLTADKDISAIWNISNAQNSFSNFRRNL